MLRRTIDHERSAHRRPVIPTTYLDGQDEHGPADPGADDLPILGLWAAQRSPSTNGLPTPAPAWRAFHWDRNYRPVSPLLRPGPIWRRMSWPKYGHPCGICGYAICECPIFRVHDENHPRHPSS